MTEKRKQLLERANQFVPVPGHRPDLDKASDEWLERYVKIMEETFEDLFGEEEANHE